MLINEINLFLTGDEDDDDDDDEGTSSVVEPIKPASPVQAPQAPVIPASVQSDLNAVADEGAVIAESSADIHQHSSGVADAAGVAYDETAEEAGDVQPEGQAATDIEGVNTQPASQPAIVHQTSNITPVASGTADDDDDEDDDDDDDDAIADVLPDDDDDDDDGEENDDEDDDDEDDLLGRNARLAREFKGKTKKHTNNKRSRKHHHARISSLQKKIPPK